MTYELWQMPYGGTGDPRCDEVRVGLPQTLSARDPPIRDMTVRWKAAS
jgi:hypothetical protein